ncbi:MAG: DNA polymerase III subunit gamma/tau, partial [Pseudomonadota bacterium]
SITEVERQRGQTSAGALSMKVLTRFWQMLLKGISEVQTAPKPLAAADMLLVRLCYAADLPSPEDLIRSLGDGPPRPGDRPPSIQGGSPPAPGPRAMLATAQPAPNPTPSAVAAPAAAPHRAIASFTDLVAFAAEKCDLPLKLALERFVRPVSLADGRLDIALESDAPGGLVAELSRKLGDWTGRRWVVALSSDGGEPTLRQKAEARQAATLTGIRAEPLVRAALEKFPGAEIIDIRDNSPEPAAPYAPMAEAAGADVVYADPEETGYDADDI